MENLIKFFLRFRSLMLFVLLEVTALILLVNHNNYHQAKLFSSSNFVTGYFFTAVDAVTDYFSLNSKNEQLSRQNTLLRNENLQLQRQMAVLKGKKNVQAPLNVPAAPELEYTFIRAKVVNNSVNHYQNYMTLNRGRRDGIEPDMGVINEQGVVGIIASVSERFAVVLPILNPQCRISSRLDSCRNFGSLIWNGKDYRYATLEEIPRHAALHIGETVSTTGFSTIFPEGIPIGTVSSFEPASTDNFYHIEVQLACDFQKVSYVDVIRFDNKQEQQELEKAE